jgi:heme/copper-type cytochrome/quinol oxidase subunit 2
VTLRGILLLSRRRDRDKRRNHGLAQGEQHDGTMLEEAIHGQSVLFILFVWFVWLIWFVLFIWLIWFIWIVSLKQKTRQTRQTKQTRSTS